MQLQNNKFPISQDDSSSHSEPQASPIDFDRLMGMARRQMSVVFVSTVIGVCAGVMFLSITRPLYTAQMSVMMDRSNNALVSQLSNVSSVLEDESSVLSQVELLKSESVGMAVVSKLKLDEDPTFVVDNRGSLMQRLTASVGDLLGIESWSDAVAVPPDAVEARRQDALNVLLRSVGVERAGRSYVLNIGYTSPDPEMAARVANAFGEAYINDKLDAKFEATQRASSWMQDRIDELRQRAIDTDLAVQKFRTANNLVSTGNLLLSDQQLSELNSALISARADTARTRAQFERIETVLQSGDPAAIVSDALNSPAISDLRKRYLDASKRESEISSTLGKNHSQAKKLRAEMVEFQRLMFSELQRIAEGYKSELEVAETREKSLNDSVAQASTTSSSANETLVQLRELQREADTYRNLYQSFLERYQQAIQQQSFPITDARVISKAAAPTKPSQPRKGLFLDFFTGLGLMVGGAIGAFREFRDRFFRTGEQIRDELGMECLGIAPLLTDVPRPVKANAPALAANALRKRSSIGDYVIDHPLSAFAEALRSAKIAVDLSEPGKACKIIGVISTLPGEGKSTVSVNLAELLAAQGARTLLIDADLRNPGATRMMAGHAHAGLLEVLLEGQPVDDLIQTNPRTGLSFLPAVIKQRIPHSSEIINSERMRQVLQQASTRYNYIILDLPPIAPVVDARAIAPRLDGIVFVVEWGKTARRAVRQSLAAEPYIADKCVGAILNKVDMEKMKLYRAYGSIDFYQSRYSSYYQES